MAVDIQGPVDLLQLRKILVLVAGLALKVIVEERRPVQVYVHVYDAYGDGSRQTDVIITNPDHPLSFPEDKSGTYVVDGVSPLAR